MKPLILLCNKHFGTKINKSALTKSITNKLEGADRELLNSAPPKPLQNESKRFDEVSGSSKPNTDTIPDHFVYNNKIETKHLEAFKSSENNTSNLGISEGVRDSPEPPYIGNLNGNFRAMNPKKLGPTKEATNPISSSEEESKIDACGNVVGPNYKNHTELPDPELPLNIQTNRLTYQQNNLTTYNCDIQKINSADRFNSPSIQDNLSDPLNSPVTLNQIKDVGIDLELATTLLDSVGEVRHVKTCCELICQFFYYNQ
jgi:hypothetical protein